jgi:hypothetical protein
MPPARRLALRCVVHIQYPSTCASRYPFGEYTCRFTEEDITMPKLTFYHRHGSDYLDTYNTDAAVVARILGLTLLTVHERHARTSGGRAAYRNTAIRERCVVCGVTRAWL